MLLGRLLRKDDVVYNMHRLGRNGCWIWHDLGWRCSLGWQELLLLFSASVSWYNHWRSC